MKKLVIVTLLSIVTSPLWADNPALLLKAKAYVNVRSGELISPANIVIENGLIKAINPEKIPQNIKTLDLGQKILLPGLMDMHTHLDGNFDGRFDDILYKENTAKGALRAARNARKTLMAGFTTVRNVGQLHVTRELVNVAVNKAARAGWIEAPRIIDAGHIISITGGHGDLIMGMAEHYGELGPDYGIVNGVDDAIKAVRFQIKHGARVIKITATAGVLSLEDSVGAQQLSDEEMRAIIKEAHRHHVKVAAHAHGTAGIIAAVKAGVDSIEHGSLVDAKGMRLMKKNGVYLVATTGLVDEIAKTYDKMDPKMASKAKYVLPLAIKNLKKAIKAGVKIALGTDAPLIHHGENAKELVALTQRGMSPLAALQAATINAADLLGVNDRGEIKTGLLADIIAVNANPLKKIETTEKVNFVMLGGQVIKNNN